MLPSRNNWGAIKFTKNNSNSPVAQSNTGAGFNMNGLINNPRVLRRCSMATVLSRLFECDCLNKNHPVLSLLNMHDVNPVIRNARLTPYRIYLKANRASTENIFDNSCRGWKTLNVFQVGNFLEHSLVDHYLSGELWPRGNFYRACLAKSGSLGDNKRSWKFNLSRCPRKKWIKDFAPRGSVLIYFFHWFWFNRFGFCDRAFRKWEKIVRIEEINETNHRGLLVCKSDIYG